MGNDFSANKATLLFYQCDFFARKKREETQKVNEILNAISIFWCGARNSTDTTKG
jgi:hypothetical protein